MKIRTDFVTNSSSASYILEIALTSEEGRTAEFELAVSTEVCSSDDGDMRADSIQLIPEMGKGDISFDGQQLSAAKSLAELSDLLFSAAKIYGWESGDDRPLGDSLEGLSFVVNGEFILYDLYGGVYGGEKSSSGRKAMIKYIKEYGGHVMSSVSEETDYLICNDMESTSAEVKKAKELGVPVINEIEFMYRFDEDGYNEYVENEIRHERITQVKEVAPKTISKFLKDCKQRGIMPENLKTIVIKNSEYGSGDSAMWVEKRDILRAFEDYRNSIGLEDNGNPCQQLVEFMKSSPALPVKDNGGILPNKMICEWEGDDESLVKAVEQLLNETAVTTHWMGTFADEYRIDVKENTIQNREVLYLWCFLPLF